MDAILWIATILKHCERVFSHTILWTELACFTRGGATTSATFTSGHGIILMPTTQVGIKSASTQNLGRNRRAHCHELLPATRQTDCSPIPWFPGNCSTGLLEALAVSRRLWFWHHGALGHNGKCVRRWLNATYPGRWSGRRKPIAWPALLPDLIPTDPPPPCEDNWRSTRLYSPSQDHRRPCGNKSYAAVTTVGANMQRHVRQNAMGRTAFEWSDGASNTYEYCNNEAPMVWLFDSLRCLTLTCILKTKRHRAYIAQYFRVFFLTRNHIVEKMYAYLRILKIFLYNVNSS
jgi:hypothetical protein